MYLTDSREGKRQLLLTRLTGVRSKSLDYEPKHIAHTLEPYTYIACSIADALYSALFSRHQIVPDMHQEQGYKTERMNEVE